MLFGKVLVMTCFFGFVSPGLADVAGSPRVIDGDTIIIGDTRIRLYGIDAPEQQQHCFSAGTAWPCGESATAALKLMVQEHVVRCEGSKEDRYGRLIGVCFVAGRNLNEAMVRAGWALAYRKYSKKYVAAEQKAVDGSLGIWRGDFVPPWEWRKKRRN